MFRRSLVGVISAVLASVMIAPVAAQADVLPVAGLSATSPSLVQQQVGDVAPGVPPQTQPTATGDASLDPTSLNLTSTEPVDSTDEDVNAVAEDIQAQMRQAFDAFDAAVADVMVGNAGDAAQLHSQARERASAAYREQLRRINDMPRSTPRWIVAAQRAAASATYTATLNAAAAEYQRALEEGTPSRQPRITSLRETRDTTLTQLAMAWSSETAETRGSTEHEIVRRHLSADAPVTVRSIFLTFSGTVTDTLARGELGVNLPLLPGDTFTLSRVDTDSTTTPATQTVTPLVTGYAGSPDLFVPGGVAWGPGLHTYRMDMTMQVENFGQDPTSPSHSYLTFTLDIPFLFKPEAAHPGGITVVQPTYKTMNGALQVAFPFTGLTGVLQSARMYGPHGSQRIGLPSVVDMRHIQLVDSDGNVFAERSTASPVVDGGGSNDRLTRIGQETFEWVAPIVGKGPGDGNVTVRIGTGFHKNSDALYENTTVVGPTWIDSFTWDTNTNPIKPLLKATSGDLTFVGDREGNVVTGAIYIRVAGWTPGESFVVKQTSPTPFTVGTFVVPSATSTVESLPIVTLVEGVNTFEIIRYSGNSETLRSTHHFTLVNAKERPLSLELIQPTRERGYEKGFFRVTLPTQAAIVGYETPLYRVAAYDQSGALMDVIALTSENLAAGYVDWHIGIANGLWNFTLETFTTSLPTDKHLIAGNSPGWVELATTPWDANTYPMLKPPFLDMDVDDLGPSDEPHQPGPRNRDTRITWHPAPGTAELDPTGDVLISMVPIENRTHPNSDNTDNEPILVGTAPVAAGELITTIPPLDSGQRVRFFLQYRTPSDVQPSLDMYVAYMDWYGSRQSHNNELAITTHATTTNANGDVMPTQISAAVNGALTGRDLEVHVSPLIGDTGARRIYYLNDSNNHTSPIIDLHHGLWNIELGVRSSNGDFTALDNTHITPTAAHPLTAWRPRGSYTWSYVDHFGVQRTYVTFQPPTSRVHDGGNIIKIDPQFTYSDQEETTPGEVFAPTPRRVYLDGAASRMVRDTYSDGLRAWSSFSDEYKEVNVIHSDTLGVPDWYTVLLDVSGYGTPRVVDSNVTLTFETLETSIGNILSRIVHFDSPLCSEVLRDRPSDYALECVVGDPSDARFDVMDTYTLASAFYSQLGLGFDQIPQMLGTEYLALWLRPSSAVTAPYITPPSLIREHLPESVNAGNLDINISSNGIITATYTLPFGTDLPAQVRPYLIHGLTTTTPYGQQTLFSGASIMFRADSSPLGKTTFITYLGTVDDFPGGQQQVQQLLNGGTYMSVNEIRFIDTTPHLSNHDASEALDLTQACPAPSTIDYATAEPIGTSAVCTPPSHQTRYGTFINGEPTHVTAPQLPQLINMHATYRTHRISVPAKDEPVTITWNKDSFTKTSDKPDIDTSDLTVYLSAFTTDGHMIPGTPNTSPMGQGTGTLTIPAGRVDKTSIIRAVVINPNTMQTSEPVYFTLLPVGSHGGNQVVIGPNPSTTPPDAPTGLTITRASTVTLVWDSTPGADHYEVSLDGGDTWNTTTTATYSHPLTVGKAYDYRVRAVNTAGEHSPETRATKPSDPRNVTATRTSDGAISITWNSPETDGGDTITRWMINIHDGTKWVGARNFTNATDMRTYLWENTPAGTTRVAVLAHNNAGPSNWIITTIN